MRVILSGGGTGGHIYPALALAEVIKENEPDSEFLYVGSERGVEKNIVPNYDIPFKSLKIQGFKRSLSLSNLKTINLFFAALKDAKKIIEDFKPDIIVGTGGYVSGAVVYAGQKLGIPTVIHEQNSVAGITNKFLSRGADAIAIAFKIAENQFPKGKTRLIGNPRAQQVASMTSDFHWSEYGLDDNKKTLLVFGGSQGAPAINLTFLDSIKHFNEQDYQVVLVTGPKRYENCQALLAERQITLADNVKIVPYIANMPEVLPKTTAIVSRAGATSIAEITVLGIPSILIPSPHVTGNHQVKNAEALVKSGAALVILETELDMRELTESADRIMNNPDIAEKMKQAAIGLGEPKATDKLYELLKDVIKNKKVNN